MAGVEGSADYSPCGSYRWWLRRDWPPTLTGGKGTCLWVMLNPSTATEFEDDNTVRRTQTFARAWGFDAVVVANIFALRSTDPAALYTCADPVGKRNDAAIHMAAQSADRVVAAWGVHGAHLDRGARVAELLADVDAEVVCLGQTKAGHPKHPLYLAAATEPYRFELSAAR